MSCARFLVLLALLPAACGDSEPEPVAARAPAVGELLITQLYTTGAPPAGGTDHYFSDQFIELSNAASDPLDLSGVRVADVFGAAGEINDGMRPDSNGPPAPVLGEARGGTRGRAHTHRASHTRRRA